MRQIIYALQFRGKAGPVSQAPPLLKAATSAPSCTINTVVGPEGVNGTIQPVGQGSATFESEVTMTGETTFQESGTITFGESRHWLHFSTVGEGQLGPSADPKLNCGAVMWQVDGGEGQFEGASGYITSNFSISDTGEVIDNHFRVIFVK